MYWLILPKTKKIVNKKARKIPNFSAASSCVKNVISPACLNGADLQSESAPFKLII